MRCSTCVARCCRACWPVAGAASSTWPRSLPALKACRTAALTAPPRRLSSGSRARSRPTTWPTASAAMPSVRARCVRLRWPPALRHWEATPMPRGRASSRASRWGAWARRRRSDRSRFIWLPMSPRSSPARRRSSTAAGRTREEEGAVKLMRVGAPGRERPALMAPDGALRDLAGIVPDIAGEVLTTRGLEALRGIDPGKLPLLPAAVRIGPPVGAVGKMICVGLNYADHAAESGMAIPELPVIFMKATTAIVGPNDELRIPRGSQKTDWEVELGVVIAG